VIGLCGESHWANSHALSSMPEELWGYIKTNRAFGIASVSAQGFRTRNMHGWYGNHSIRHPMV